METKKLDRPTWGSFFKDLTRQLESQQAFVEIASDSLGDETEADWAALQGLTYDPKADLFEIGLPGLEHLVHRPQDVFLAYDNGRLASLEIIDADQIKHIIRLRNPVSLPAPQGATSE